MNPAKRIFITGTNRGLGKILTRLLIKQHPDVECHITSRGDPASFSKVWTDEFPNSKVQTYQVNLNSIESIRQNASIIQNEKKVKLDTIIASAAVGFDLGQVIPTHQIAKRTLQTNVDSTVTFVKEFLPLLSHNGRVVIVSSLNGTLSIHSQRIKELLRNPSLTEEDILNISRDYVESAARKDMKDYHWSAYKTSKALLNAWYRHCLPKYLKPGQESIILCPGWCQTDMGGKLAPLPAEEGGKRINKAIRLQQTNPAMFFNQKFVSFET